MKRIIFILIFSAVILSSLVPNLAYCFEQKVVQGNGLQFWTETFGNKKDPAILLVMGNAGQAILWPQSFCEQLAAKGYFVIRYDHRDVGLSSSMDYKRNPYTLLDMAKDAIAICDGYNLEKVHVLGASMGGEIAMILGAYFPERIKSLTLLMTSTDMQIAFDALQGKASTSTNPLSKPTDEYIAWVQKMMQNHAISMEEKVQQAVEGFRLANGNKLPLDETLVQELALQSFVRTHDSSTLSNHSLAIQASYDLHKDAVSKIKAPTLILHGDADPIFPIDHAYATQKAIPHAKLVIVPGMGHAINTPLFSVIIKNVDSIARSS